MTCAVPGPGWYRSTLPPVPTFTVTAFGIVVPALDQFRFDAVGRATPVGETVKTPPDVVSVTVTFSTTAETPDAGTPPTPVTCTDRDSLAPSLPPLERVSRILDGDSATNEPGAPVTAVPPVHATSSVGADTPSIAFTAPDPSLPD